MLWVGQLKKRSRYKTGRKETEPTRELCISGWNGLRGRRHGDENSQENTSWGECMEESEWVMGETYISEAKQERCLAHA